MRRPITRVLILFCLVSVVLSAGCAFAPRSGFQPREEPKPEKKEVEQVEDFDPLPLDTDDVAEPERKEPSRVATEERDTLSIGPATEPAKGIEEVQGYRVQIFVSSDRENAQKIVEEAGEIFTERVYVQYDAPYYKVRIGDCLTRREADLLQGRAVRHGYRDAWVVRSLVMPEQQ